MGIWASNASNFTITWLLLFVENDFYFEYKDGFMRDKWGILFSTKISFLPISNWLRNFFKKPLCSLHD